MFEGLSTQEIFIVIGALLFGFGLVRLLLTNKVEDESPRELRRLQTLRRWSHEQEIKPFFT